MSGLTREEINRLNDLKNESTQKELALENALIAQFESETKVSFIDEIIPTLETEELSEEDLQALVNDAIEREIITEQEGQRIFEERVGPGITPPPQDQFEVLLKAKKRNLNSQIEEVGILQNDIQELQEGIQDLESRRTPDQAFSDIVLSAARDGTGTIAYPADVTANHPYLLFRALRPLYEGGRIARNFQVGGIALYMPMAYAIGDSLSYETADAGIFGGAAQDAITNFREEEGAASQIGAVDIARLLTRSISEASEQLGEAGETVGGQVARRIGRVAGDFLTPGTNVGAIVDRTRGRVSNPHQFSIFQTPDMRSFNFNFIFIPQNEWEARIVPLIIKFFRTAAYPSVAPGGLEYIIPDSFSITLGNLNQNGDQTVIRIPEVFCTGVNVSYNPRSMSYFKYNNMPSEIEMQLNFREVQPITREMVEEGY